MTPLKRELGLRDAVVVGWGAMVGAGVFVVFGVGAQIAGPAFLVGLLIAGSVAIANALASASLAARFPRSGGTYEYGWEMIHPAAGFAAGWMFLVSKLSAGGTVALGLGLYLRDLGVSLPPAVVGAGAVIALGIANSFGIRKVGALNLAIVSVTMISLVVLAVFAAPVQASNFEPFAPQGWASIFPAAAVLFFAFTGYARIATLAEEIREPEVTIPRAVRISLGSTLLLYLAIGWVAVGVLGAEGLAQAPAPLAAVAERASVPGLVELVQAGALTAMLGVILSQILGISRVMLAMARRNDLPSVLDRVNPTRGIPWVAVLVTTAIMVAIALIGRLEAVIAAAAFSILLYYAITNVAALRLPTSPVQKLVPAFGLAGCLILAVSLDLATIRVGLGILAAGFVFRAILHRSAPKVGSDEPSL